MKKLFDEYFKKTIDFIFNKLLELIFATNTGVLVISYIFKWHFINKVFKNLFFYLTLFLGVVLLFKLVMFLKEQKEIKDEYIALDNSNNWDLMFAEKTILDELVRRDLQIFEGDMVNSGLIQEYIEDIHNNYDPDLPVMELLDKTYSKLHEPTWCLTIINNLLNRKFITQVPNRCRVYKINSSIWKYKQAEKRKREKKELKRQKEFNKQLLQKRKPKLIYTKYEGSHKVFGFFGIRVKLKVHNEFE